jgi:hypothetical protein
MRCELRRSLGVFTPLLVHVGTVHGPCLMHSRLRSDLSF